MNKKIRISFVFTACKQSGPIQQMFNLIKYLDKDVFEPILITLYDEPTDGTSRLKMYTDYGIEHYRCPLSKLDILLGKTSLLRKMIADLNVDVIHSLGVFPDYAIAKMKTGKQIITLRNYVWDDYPDKFGKIKGTVLANLHLYAMKHSAKTVACSESLSKLYSNRLGLNYDFVRNGVDVEKFNKSTTEQRLEIRKRLGLPHGAFIFVYSGQMLNRKNQKFLLDVFTETFDGYDPYLLLLGDGPDYQDLRKKFGQLPNVDFRGNVKNVNDFLKASDVYVSTSKSEGMPNGVLEAMATGLPVILSDIEQHLEVYNICKNIGYIYRQNNSADLSNVLTQMFNGNVYTMAENAYKVTHDFLSASTMSANYQNLYRSIANK